MSLQVDRLHKTFDGIAAVDNLSFSMEEPGVFGLLGTNGAGKTTTIRCILGIMRPDSGSAAWDGEPITEKNLRFGYMPEERGLYMKAGVLEQLVYFGMLRGMEKRNAKEAALSFLKRLDVLEYKDMDAEKLSKGNQQKIQLIAALVHDPKLVFLDEPFSGLDPVNAEILKALVHELVREGKFVVLSSHQMSTVEEYCRDILILHRGKTVLKGNLQTIKNGYGHTNLVVAAPGDITALAKEHGLVFAGSSPAQCGFKITGYEMANTFLKVLLDNGIFPTKYEVTQPSLNEIFIEKVGTAV